MKNMKWYNWILLVIVIFILVLVFNEKARANFFYWWCNAKNKRHKIPNSPCTSCVPPGSQTLSYKGIITASGDCIQDPAQIYGNCLANNASKSDGTECDNCVPPAGLTASESNSTVLDGYVNQYKGVVVDGKCMPLPDAFAGKICTPNSASVTASELSYKRVLQTGTELEGQNPIYKYYSSNTTTVNPAQASMLDTEITKEDYIQAYVQTIKLCPKGQVKV